MTAAFVLAGIATLLVLLTIDGSLRSGWVLLPGVAVASVAALVASWLPAPVSPQPWWVSALVPAASVLVFLLVVGHFRRHGRSTSRSRR